MNYAPVLIVDDDGEDREFLQEAWNELNFKNPLLYFKNGNEVLQYLQSENTKPFLIICDVNIPVMDGFELKKKLLEDRTMNYKSIPFVFWSSQVSKTQIQKAYDLGANGFFVKENNLRDLKQSLFEIVMYWLKSKTPE
jgi:CheY-like chemotaxis protein